MVNFDSAYLASQEFVHGTEASHNDVQKVFIYTGNWLNLKSLPGYLSLGVGKSSASYLMSTAAYAYGGKGYR